MLDSLVRVSRRVDENHFVGIPNARTAEARKRVKLPQSGPA